MINLLIILTIFFGGLTNCSDLPFCPRPEGWFTPGQSVPGAFRVSFDQESVFHSCGKTCQGLPPKIDNLAFTSLSPKNVLENIELVCEPSHINRIIKIVVENHRLQYNSTCNGVVSGVKHDPGVIYKAIVVNKNKEETHFPIKANLYRYSANYLMGSEQFSEYAELKHGICDGGKLSSYSVWIPNDPLEGCCAKDGDQMDGIRQTRAVFYRLKISGGKCCTVCNLLYAKDDYQTPLLMKIHEPMMKF